MLSNVIMRTNASRNPETINDVTTRYVRDGYRVLSQSENAVQLVRPKHLDLTTGLALAIIVPLIGAAIWWLVNVQIGIAVIAVSQIGFIVHVLAYLDRVDQTVYVYVGTSGTIQVITSI